MFPKLVGNSHKIKLYLNFAAFVTNRMAAIKLNTLHRLFFEANRTEFHLLQFHFRGDEAT